MEKALLHFNDQRYELRAWCVMPNHVHVLVQVWQTPLGKMIQSWKRFVAVNAETALAGRRSSTRRGSNDESWEASRFRWQREYWDTFMRNAEQERKAIAYIEANPVKAKLCASAVDWKSSSARLRDEYGRLAVRT